jgi:hypothetical protein
MRLEVTLQEAAICLHGGERNRVPSSLDPGSVNPMKKKEDDRMNGKDLVQEHLDLKWVFEQASQEARVKGYPWRGTLLWE